MSPTLEH